MHGRDGVSLPDDVKTQKTSTCPDRGTSFATRFRPAPCRRAAALPVHALATKLGLSANVFAGTALLKFSCRSRRLREAQQQFDENAWQEMRRLNVQPNHTTFLLVLTACSRVGLVDKGLQYFNLMKTNRFLAGAPLEHYTCMVDLLGRAGQSLINDMPIEPGVSVYRALLSACQIHGSLEIAIRVSRRLVFCSCSVIEGHCW